MTNREKFNQEVSNEDLARMIVKYAPTSKDNFYSSQDNFYFPFNNFPFDKKYYDDAWDFDQMIRHYAEWLSEEC